MVGLRPRVAGRRDARANRILTFIAPAALGPVTLWNMRGPGLAGLRIDMSETGARRRTGNTDEVLASWTLNLPASVARVALQRLIAVGAVKLEVGGIHKLYADYAQNGNEKYMKNLLILFVLPVRMYG
jgi:hypothetical protein